MRSLPRCPSRRTHRKEPTENIKTGGSGAGPGKRQAYDRKKGFFRESESGHFPGPCSAPPDAPEKVFSKHNAGGEGCRGGGAAAGLSWLPTWFCFLGRFFSVRPAAWAPRQAPHWLPCPGVAPLGGGSAAAPGGARGLMGVSACVPFSRVRHFFCVPFSLIRHFGASSGALGCFGHKKHTKLQNQLRKRRILRSCQFLPKGTILPKRNEGRRR